MKEKYYAQQKKIGRSIVVFVLLMISMFQGAIIAQSGIVPGPPEAVEEFKITKGDKFVERWSIGSPLGADPPVWPMRWYVQTEQGYLIAWDITGDGYVDFYGRGSSLALQSLWYDQTG